MSYTPDTSAIKKFAYNIWWKRFPLGAIKLDSTRIGINGRYSTIEVDNIGAIVAKALHEGWNPVVETVLHNTSPDFVAPKLMQPELVELVAGTDGDFYGIGDTEIDMALLADLLEIIPTANATGNKRNSFAWWKAYPDLSALQLIGSKNNWQEVAVQFTFLADETKPKKMIYGGWGNINAEGIAPSWTIVTLGDPKIPYIHQAALDVVVGQSLDLQASQIYKTDGSAGALNEAADITSADTSFDLDGFPADAMTSDTFIMMGTELMYVETWTPSSSTAGTASGVIRGCAGTTAAAHLDNAVVTIINITNVWPSNQPSTWASSDATKATVGNAEGETGANQKGRLKGVAAGSSNITATANSVASPNCAVTVT